MKVTVFNGSPAAAQSATHVMADAFLRGAARAGAEVEEIFLAEKNIRQCQGCFACWFKTPRRCIIQDDMADLIAAYQASDIIVFGTPVYTWNMTALLKNFVDRLAPLKAPRMTEQQGHFDLENAQPKTQTFVALANCGFPGENNFDVLRAAMACANPTLEIYRNCGKLLTSKQPLARERVEKWLSDVERAGQELAVGGEVSVEMRATLAAPLMSVEEYVAFLGM